MLKSFKKITAAGLITLLITPAIHSAEVIGHSNDNTGGQVTGGSILFLIGGAAGGPAGALVGAFLGTWVGDKTQQQAGLSGDRYTVITEQGETHAFRSPNREFELGDQVDIVGIRLQPAP
ncbi:MAG: energy-converting hydrogenase Eha subunit B [Porticoccus sp.]|jgi:hypothetical protein|uniref:hypothetical protein n=1 Tax=Porticoccus sp. TaxID=2024853 RepID=UPI0039E24F5A|tara:strand:+ start:206251 stop:206610 length:360 start_codon:yes stop_codon:yes gene_type:complete